MAPTLFQSAFSSLLLISSSFTLSGASPQPVGHAALSKRAVIVSSTLPTPWTSKGCYTEATNGRALTGSAYTNNAAMTEESCINYCNGKGYVFAGVEYSAECYCGNTMMAGSVAAAATDCNMACSGNATEACGGPGRLNVFSNGKTPPPPPTVNPGPPGWKTLGCYTDTNVRALGAAPATPGGSAAMTIAICTTACQSGNYLYAGVEYAGECYCGNSFAGNNGPAPDGATGCNMVCNGNATEFCGGPNRLDVYGTNGAPPPPVPTTTTAGPTPTGTGTATQLPSGWSYQGCWVDNVNGGRVMPVQNPDNQALTIESCTNSCLGQGYSVAGMEYGVQCFCGNNLQNGGKLATADTDCNTACGGNAAEKCGAGNRLSVYSNATIKVIAPPTIQKTNLPGAWQYSGCISETSPNRVFKYQTILAANNTPTECLSRCSAFGYGAAGIEYGQECYCGDPANVQSSGSVLEPDTDCNIVCPGNGSYYCGGGNRLSYYTWSAVPSLNTWSYPTGNAAGAYQFLIGGVVIPLITTQTIEGKVLFTEKHGTGPPNSTGAYELDLTQVNNFTAAWRTLNGLKTDVFCSAGLVLPDKVGRVINIGGWSGTSTYGTRLYIPGGQPGYPTRSTDWQENAAEVHLQNGRWYPSAMIMANGSILVIGGENGSNGPPVPTLEVLPQPAGGTALFADWLNRTDPFNLYPFPAVLPSGGIFMAYYNEARILDENTLQTIKTLPPIPGSVNNPASGRTYPLEGTTVLMPQYAPYSDPLTIMICGGSNPGAAIALDNCASIQPDAPNPSWLLERMPSQRVMTCITALPDGTYMIMNGAHQGAAGFGLATSPNLNAILYDPSKPATQRMSVMANTTVARLYHSESILLADGRVLVSGSDPQDNVNPQEYRVEVFVPPYRLSGLAPPTFTIASRDWAYGGSYAVTVTLLQGTTAGMRISLIGAESSTHGNSMGQRTIFPAFTCAGNTCTITAPPNSHVCPPGWFQLFVLDGPTPSHSTYVRIGGDPGSLGAWPSGFSDFTTPGIGPLAT